MTKKSIVFVLYVFFVLTSVYGRPTDSLRVEMRGGKKYIIHRVVRGESITSLAAHYGVDEGELVNSNPLITGAVFPGQVIKVPLNTTKYGDVEAKSIVPLSNSSLPLAKTLPSPSGSKPSANMIMAKADDVVKEKPVVPVAPKKEAPKVTYKTYVVASPQTVGQLANTFEIDPKEIIQLNNLKSYRLQVGQIVKIPFHEEQELAKAEPVVEPPAKKEPVVVAKVEAPKPAAPMAAMSQRVAPPRPPATKPAVSQPVAEKPVISQPLVSQPVAKKPVVTAPVAAVIPPPVVTPPVVTTPIVSSPVVTAKVIVPKDAPAPVAAAAISAPMASQYFDSTALKARYDSIACIRRDSMMLAKKYKPLPQAVLKNPYLGVKSFVVFEIPNLETRADSLKADSIIRKHFKTLSMHVNEPDAVIDRFDSAYRNPDGFSYKVFNYTQDHYFYDVWGMKAANANAINVTSTNQSDGVGDKNYTHVVKTGETLESIAKKYNVSTSDLINWNDIYKYRVRVGQDLIVNKQRAKLDYLERAMPENKPKGEGAIVSKETEIGLGYYSSDVELHGVYCNNVPRGKYIYILNRDNFEEYFARVDGPLPKNTPAKTIIQVDKHVADKLRIDKSIFNIEVWYGLVKDPTAQ